MKTKRLILSDTETSKKKNASDNRKICAEIKAYLTDNQNYYKETGDTMDVPKHLKKYFTSALRIKFRINRDSIHNIMKYIEYKFFTKHKRYYGGKSHWKKPKKTNSNVNCRYNSLTLCHN